MDAQVKLGHDAARANELHCITKPGQPAGGTVQSIIEIANMLLGGLAAGMVLFIVSVGLSVTMGLMGFVNLAHGGFAMIGGYTVVLVMNRFGMPYVPALAKAFLFVGA